MFCGCFEGDNCFNYTLTGVFTFVYILDGSSNASNIDWYCWGQGFGQIFTWVRYAWGWGCFVGLDCCDFNTSDANYVRINGSGFLFR